jgi:hypothetical protein
MPGSLKDSPLGAPPTQAETPPPKVNEIICHSLPSSPSLLSIWVSGTLNHYFLILTSIVVMAVSPSLSVTFNVTV